MMVTFMWTQTRGHLVATRQQKKSHM